MKKSLGRWFETGLQKIWYRRDHHSNWLLILWPLSQLFRVLVAIRLLAYRRGWLKIWHAPVPVIIVGNITVGGSGKTPLVLWLAEFLGRNGLHPGIISRGYGGFATFPVAVTVNSEAAMVGDEPLLLARRTSCPVWVGRSRVDTAQSLLAAHPECDVLISDDGLQHYALARDVEISVVDGLRRLGNSLLLPAGPLRELPLRLKTVDAVVIHGKDARREEYSMHLAGTVFRNVFDSTLTVDASSFSGMQVHAVAGIGNPQRFFDALNGMAIVCKTHVFPDHYAFQLKDLQFEEPQTIIMTEKDAVKCLSFAQPNWWFLEVNAEVDQALGQQILQKLRGWNG